MIKSVYLVLTYLQYVTQRTCSYTGVRHLHTVKNFKIGNAQIITLKGCVSTHEMLRLNSRRIFFLNLELNSWVILKMLKFKKRLQSICFLRTSRKQCQKRHLVTFFLCGKICHCVPVPLWQFLTRSIFEGSLLLQCLGEKY